MKIPITFNAAGFPKCDFRTCVQHARALGFAGMELPASHDGSIATANNALLTAPEKIQAAVAGSDTRIVSLATSFVTELAEVIAVAQLLAVPLVRVLRDLSINRQKFLDAVQANADRAASAGVTILMENQPKVESSVRLWRALDDLNHPNIAASANLQSVLKAGESPTVVIPTLNSRIRMLRLHAGIDPRIRQTAVQRLAGIGFNGVIVIDATDETELATLAKAII